jgi:hypothetical protein
MVVCERIACCYNTSQASCAIGRGLLAGSANQVLLCLSVGQLDSPYAAKVVQVPCDLVVGEFGGNCVCATMSSPGSEVQRKILQELYNLILCGVGWIHKRAISYHSLSFSYVVAYCEPPEKSIPASLC